MASAWPVFPRRSFMRRANDSERVCNVLTEDTGNAEYALPDLDHRAHKTSMRRCGSGRQLRSQSPLRMDGMIHSLATANGS
jgi:hypothetical protein